MSECSSSDPTKMRYEPLTPVTMEMIEACTPLLVRHFTRETADQDGANGLYAIEDIATHSETGEKMVIARSPEQDGELIVSPLDMFLGEVDREKYPDIKQKYKAVTCTSEDCMKLLAYSFDLLKKNLFEGTD